MRPQEINVHVHFHSMDSEVESQIIKQLQRIEVRLQDVQHSEREQMADLSAITQEVTDMGDVVGGAVTLLGSLADMIRANATDQTALNDLANTLDSQKSRLADAIVANTPAA